MLMICLGIHTQTAAYEWLKPTCRIFKQESRRFPTSSVSPRRLYVLLSNQLLSIFTCTQNTPISVLLCQLWIVVPRSCTLASTYTKSVVGQGQEQPPFSPSSSSPSLSDRTRQFVTAIHPVTGCDIVPGLWKRRLKELWLNCEISSVQSSLRYEGKVILIKYGPRFGSLSISCQKCVCLVVVWRCLWPAGSRFWKKEARHHLQ